MVDLFLNLFVGPRPGSVGDMGCLCRGAVHDRLLLTVLRGFMYSVAGYKSFKLSKIEKVLKNWVINIDITVGSCNNKHKFE